MAVKKTNLGYQIQWYDVDGRFRKRTVRGVTREEAVRIERDILSKRDRGEPQVNERNAPTFAVFSATWADERRSGWKASTLQQYQQVLHSQLLPEFGERRVTNITEGQIRRFITRLQDEGLSARRTNLSLLVLKMILRAAYRRRLIREEPYAGIRSLPAPRTEVDPLDPEEVETFLSTCPPHWQPYFTVSFWTGARPGELAALRWGDVDWVNGKFRIRAGRYRGVEGPPKTASSIRDVDILPPVAEALKLQKAQQAARRIQAGEGAPDRGEDYVFTGRNGGLLNGNYLRDRVWYPTLTKAGLRRRTMYQTRHSFASNALAAGEAPSWVSAMLGHTTPEILFKVYSRYIPNKTRQDGSAFASRMEGGEGSIQSAESMR